MEAMDEGGGGLGCHFVEQAAEGFKGMLLDGIGSDHGEAMEMDESMGEEDWNDWRVAQTVAVALERQATWHLRMIRPNPFQDDKMPITQSLLSVFADEMDDRAGLRDFVNVTYLQTKVSAACLVVAGIYMDRVRALLRMEDETEFSGSRLLLLVAVLTASKVYDVVRPDFQNNKCGMSTWAEAAGITVERLKELELVFQFGISGLKFFVTKEEYEAKLSALIQRALCSSTPGVSSVDSLSPSKEALIGVDADVVEALAGSDLFEHLPEELLPMIAKTPQTWTVEEGEVLTKVGEFREACLVIVVDGELEGTKVDGTTRKLSKSMSYGQRAVFASVITKAYADMANELDIDISKLFTSFDENIRAVKKTKLLQLTKEELWELCDLYPRIMYNVDHMGVLALNDHTDKGSKETAAALDIVNSIHPLLPTGLLKGIPPNDIKAIETMLEVKSNVKEYSVGKYIVRQGQQGDSFFVVISGLLNCIVNGQVVRQFGPRQIFGEVALVAAFASKLSDRIPESMRTDRVGFTMCKLSVRTADIVCAEQCHAMEITPAMMHNVFTRCPQVFDNLFERARGRLLEAVANDSRDARLITPGTDRHTKRTAAPTRQQRDNHSPHSGADSPANRGSPVHRRSPAARHPRLLVHPNSPTRCHPASADLRFDSPTSPMTARPRVGRTSRFTDQGSPPAPRLRTRREPMDETWLRDVQETEDQ